MDLPPQTSSRENIGKRCVIAFIVVTACFDALTKGATLLAGTLRVSSLVGSLLTALLLYFLWRGATVAWWITVGCIGLAMLLCAVAAVQMPLWFTFGFFGFLLALLAY